MKKNFRFVPEHLLKKIKENGSKDIQIVGLKRISAEEISNGKLAHLGITLNDGKLDFKNSVLPHESSGKYSNRNLNGQTIVRRDLPKEDFVITMHSPNWNGTGTHTVNIVKQRYLREFIAPHLTSIEISTDMNVDNGFFTLSFRLDEIINPASRTFEKDILRCINLMQENVGNVDILSSDVTVKDYLGSLIVGWEILPPGTRDQAYARIFKGRTPTQEQIDQFDDRYSFFKSLKPVKEIFGTNGMNRYFGAQLKDDLVVFENYTYGNAMYVMYKEWDVLSKFSRIELLSGSLGKNFDRVPHYAGWKDKVKKLIEVKS